MRLNLAGATVRPVQIILMGDVTGHRHIAHLTSRHPEWNSIPPYLPFTNLTSLLARNILFCFMWVC